MSEKKNKSFTIKSESKYLRISPSKLRRVLKGLSVYKKNILLFRNYLKSIPLNSSKLLLKCLDSAVANANHNFNTPQENLIIKQFLVNEGPRLKRFHARARGRGGKITKSFSHICVELSVKVG